MAAAQQQQQQQRQPILVQDLALVNHVSSMLNISPQNAIKLLSVLPETKRLVPEIETEQGADLKRQLQEVKKIVERYHANQRLNEQHQQREQYFAALAARNAPAVPQPPQPSPVTAPVLPPAVVTPVTIQTIHDPEEITR
ncbi:hypothetical protein FRC17_007628, partial [Serendipita sp. 399]